MRLRYTVSILAVLSLLLGGYFVFWRDSKDATTSLSKHANQKATQPRNDTDKTSRTPIPIQSAGPSRMALFDEGGNITEEAMTAGSITQEQKAAIIAARERALRKMVELDVIHTEIAYDKASQTITGSVLLYPREGERIGDELREKLRSILGDAGFKKLELHEMSPGSSLFEISNAGLTKKKFSIKSIDGGVMVETEIVLEIPNPIQPGDVLPLSTKRTGPAKNFEALSTFQKSLREIVTRKTNFRF